VLAQAVHLGVFVAKEIEEMTTSPHSDLGQLSLNAFLSSWLLVISLRHHRDGDIKGSKGRLYFTLEMSLKDNATGRNIHGPFCWNEMAQIYSSNSAIMAGAYRTRVEQRGTY
jgi:hypothetical protein